jgi:4-amino-4-deoxy-L-arabinose transferase-like glycosyltransferase
MKARSALFIFLGVATMLRLLFASQAELAPDEAYYTMWSERMDICYYSKGPGIAATIWLGTHLFGMNEFGIRLFAPLLALGTSLMVFQLGRRLYDETVGTWAAFMINCLPIFNAGALIMTIDALSIFFWTAALYTMWRALERSPAFSGWWPATGALIGAGFLCKYTNAMQLVSIVLLLAITRKYRRELARPGFAAMIAAFLPCTLPPLIWNARHDWITIGHLSARGGLEKAFTFEPTEFFTFVLQHFGVYSIILFAMIVIAVAWAVPTAKQKFKPRFLLSFGLPLWALYLWLALKQAGEANWTAPAMVSLGILTTALWLDAARRSSAARTVALAGLTLGLLTTALVLDTDLFRRIGIPLSYEIDPSKRLRGWRSSATKIAQVRAAFEERAGQQAFLIASSYGVAADLGFYLPDKRLFAPGHPPIYFPESQQIENQFSFWPRYDEFITVPPEQLAKDAYFTEEMGVNPFHGRNALYITDRAEERPPSTVKGGFERTEMIACIDQKRRGLPLRQWRVFACYNYRSLPL